MSQARAGDGSLRIHPLEVGIIVLAGATAFLHLSLGLSSRHPTGFPFPVLFYLNAAGYLVLITLLYLPVLQPIQRYIRWLLILYTAVTIFAWVTIGDRDMDGFLDKGIEIALILLLLLEEWRATRQRRVAQPA
ncbi:MAG TPA: hypothetical protein VH590_10165 [Ktedonobacterales bacterium]|jgi:hypothetical protein